MNREFLRQINVRRVSTCDNLSLRSLAGRGAHLELQNKAFGQNSFCSRNLVSVHAGMEPARPNGRTIPRAHGGTHCAARHRAEQRNTAKNLLSRWTRTVPGHHLLAWSFGIEGLL